MANDRLSIPQIETTLAHSQFGIGPYSTYESLRSEAPVCWSDAFNAWIDLAYPLPATVIGELFGAPAEGAELCKKWSSPIGSFQRLDDLAPASPELSWNISGVFRRVKKPPLTFTPSSAGTRLATGPAH